MEEKKKNAGLERRIRQHVRAVEHYFFAVVQPGFEGTCLKELQDMSAGHSHVAAEGGISFKGTVQDCYKCCLLSRTASRVLMRLFRFRADNFKLFHREILSFPWELYLAGMPASFSITASKSRLYHTGRLQQEAEDAVRRRLSEAGIDAEDTGNHQTVFVRMEHDTCHLSLDASGGLLYKRGQKRLITRAPLRETTAACILLEAGIEDADVLADPMCGSGTFSLEAAGISSGQMPGENRFFSFMEWPVFSRASFDFLKRKLRDEGKQNGRKLAVLASDIDPEAADAAGKNFVCSGTDLCTAVPEVRDFFSEKPEIPEGKSLVVMNPPYGSRLKQDDIFLFYRKIGEKLRSDWSDSGWAVIVPGHMEEEALNIPWDKKIPFRNGGIRAAVLFRKIPD